MMDWYTVSYPDGSKLAVRTRDEAVRIANSDGRVYGVSTEVRGPFSKAEACDDADFSYLP